MTDQDIHESLIKWLRNATGLLFIKDRQSGTLPALPYGVATMTGIDEVRDHPQNIEAERLDVQSLLTPVIETEWQFSLHVYGNDGTTVLRKLRSNYHLSQTNEPLMPAITIHEISQIRKIDDYVNEAWEPTAQMDIYLRGLTRDGVVVDTIEEVEIITQRKHD